MPIVSLFNKIVRQPICSVMTWFGADMERRHSDNALRLKYESEYDLLSVWIGAPQPVDQIEVEPGVYVRISRAEHRPVGLEVIEAVSRLHTDPSTIQTDSFARELLKTYGRKAKAAFSTPLASPVR